MPNPLPNECDGKKPYQNKQECISAATAFSIKKGDRLRAYKCHTCGKFHMGHQTKRSKMKPDKIRVLKFR